VYPRQRGDTHRVLLALYPTSATIRWQRRSAVRRRTSHRWVDRCRLQAHRPRSPGYVRGPRRRGLRAGGVASDGAPQRCLAGPALARSSGPFTFRTPAEADKW